MLVVRKLVVVNPEEISIIIQVISRASKIHIKHSIYKKKPQSPATNLFTTILYQVSCQNNSKFYSIYVLIINFYGNIPRIKKNNNFSLTKNMDIESIGYK